MSFLPPALARAAALLFLGASSLLLSACPEPEPVVYEYLSEFSSAEDTLGLEMLTGDYPDFVPLEDSDVLLLHRGPQGGQHVEFGLRLREPHELVRLQMGLFEPGTGRGLVRTADFDTSFREDLNLGAPANVTLLYVDAPSMILDVPLRLVAKVTVGGEHGYAVRNVSVRWAP
jgi:hypothetical protein